jgi:hypothetical protein
MTWRTAGWALILLATAVVVWAGSVAIMDTAP